MALLVQRCGNLNNKLSRQTSVLDTLVHSTLAFVCSLDLSKPLWPYDIKLYDRRRKAVLTSN